METQNNLLPPLAEEANKNVFVMKNTFSEHGNEIEEIISNKPPLIVRWGTIYFMILLMMFILICWFIQYPDLVNTKAKLTSINAPKEVITKTPGKLIKLFAKEGEQTTSGSILGYIESTASHEEVLKFASNLDSIQESVDKNKTELLKKYFQNTYIKLGELQPFYQTFAQSYLTFRNYLLHGFYNHKKLMLVKDMDNLKKLSNSLKQQKELQTQDLTLVQKTFDANQSLKNDKVISELDYRNEQSKLINKKLSLPQISSAIISNEGLQNEKQKEMMELDNTTNQQRAIFQQALNTFKSEVEDWKRKYVLIAPLSGKVAFASFMQENQQLQANQTICFINPENSQYFAQIVIPQSNFGKVAVGQRVLLKFSSYPFQEYGSVKGKIEFISHIPTDSGYIAKVSLPDGLLTNYKKQVQYREGLSGNGEIITKDMRLAQRFYYNIIKQVSQK